MLKISELSVSYDGSRTFRFPGLELAAGEKCTLIGPSGCGKTTLLSLIAGFLTPQTGSVVVDGQELTALTPQARDKVRGRLFGFVFQTLHLLPSLTLRQNVALAAVMANLPVDAARLDQLLARLGLADKAGRKPDALSHGEAQRAAIARAVLNRPKILVADEPTSALDDVNARAVIQLLQEQAAEAGSTLLVATHDGRITDGFPRVVSLEIQREAA